VSEASHQPVEDPSERGARRLSQVCVDGGRGDAAVTKQDLHDSDIDTALDQSSGISVTQTTRRVAVDAGGLGCGREGSIERPTPNRSGAGLVGKQPAGMLVGLPELAQIFQNWPGQRDDALFVALTNDA
jgi:hypothetical protein